MVPIVQLVRASDCGSECRGFESHWAPLKRPIESVSFFCALWGENPVRNRRSRLSEAKESHWAPLKRPIESVSFFVPGRGQQNSRAPYGSPAETIESLSQFKKVRMNVSYLKRSCANVLR